MAGGRFWNRMLGLLAWVALLAYVTAAARYCSRQKEQQMCSGVRVRVLDSASLGFITPGMVRNWFAAENMQLGKQELSRINTLELDRFIARRGFVKSVRVFTTMDGMLNVELTQRRPVARVNSANGYNFYITEDHYILPLQRYHVEYVPVITGHLDAPFPRDFIGSFDELGAEAEKKTDKNYVFLSKLINFVKFVSTDDFWNSFVVQINLTEGGVAAPEVEIVPRVGNQIVLLGGLDDYETKLDKLLTFYRNGLAYDGWGRYRYINLKYRGQVVCVK